MFFIDQTKLATSNTFCLRSLTYSNNMMHVSFMCLSKVSAALPDLILMSSRPA